MIFNITATCEGGHRQVTAVDGTLGPVYAQRLAKMLDGTSEMYVNRLPDHIGVIGRCGICAAPFTCEVSESFA